MSVRLNTHSNNSYVTPLVQEDQGQSYLFVCSQEGPFSLEALFEAGQYLLSLKNEHENRSVSPEPELVGQMDVVERKIRAQWEEFPPEQQEALKALKPTSQDSVSVQENRKESKHGLSFILAARPDRVDTQVLYQAGLHLLYLGENLSQNQRQFAQTIPEELFQNMQIVGIKIGRRWKEFSSEQQEALKDLAPKIVEVTGHPDGANTKRYREVVKKGHGVRSAHRHRVRLNRHRSNGDDDGGWRSTFLKVAALMVTLYVGYCGVRCAYNWYRKSSQ